MSTAVAKRAGLVASLDITLGPLDPCNRALGLAGVGWRHQGQIKGKKIGDRMSQRAVGLGRRGGHCLAGMVIAGLLGLAPSASAADFTYSGTGQAVGTGFQGAWSESSNWVGGTAPTGSVGTVVFPPSQGCTNANPSGCITVDDISGLSVDAIRFETGYIVGGVTGDPLTLGSGGLTVQAAANTSSQVHPSFSPSIILSAPQTWSIVGHSKVQVASVTGATEPLWIVFDNLGSNSPAFLPRLDLADDVEAGAITAQGPGAIDLVGAPFSLNGTDGNPVSLNKGADLFIGSPNASTGPLTSAHGRVQLGRGSTPEATLSVTGSGKVSLDSKSSMQLFIDKAGRTPGKAYSQLRAHGAVTLGGAELTINGPVSGPYCAKLHRGDVDTLVTTTGSLSGRFRAWDPLRRVAFAVRNGTTVPVSCTAGAEDWNFVHAPRVRIRYTAHRVIATVVRAHSN